MDVEEVKKGFGLQLVNVHEITTKSLFVIYTTGKEMPFLNSYVNKSLNQVLLIKKNQFNQVIGKDLFNEVIFVDDVTNNFDYNLIEHIPRHKIQNKLPLVFYNNRFGTGYFNIDTLLLGLEFNKYAFVNCYDEIYLVENIKQFFQAKNQILDDYKKVIC